MKPPIRPGTDFVPANDYFRARHPNATQGPDVRKPLMLLALLVLADAMIWQVSPGLSIAVMSLTVIGAACLMAPPLPPKRAMSAGVAALLAVAPVINLVQPLSVFLLLIGLSTSLCLVAGVGANDLIRSALRYPFVAGLATFSHAQAVQARTKDLRPSEASIKTFMLAWTLPLTLSVVFLLLFVGANPIIKQITADVLSLQPFDLPLERFFFWGATAIALTCALIAPHLHKPLVYRGPARHTVKRVGLLNADSVTRSLILFNLIFAVQTFSDIFFLYGTTELPYGMRYATYAHRGAYPLLATALLAGVFAVLARPFAEVRPLLKAALLVWLVQTLALVVASISRLEIYVDVYGLTRLRVAAGLWMGVVAVGIGLVIWQVYQRRNTNWMLGRATLLGLAALYLCAFLNIDRMVAVYNLTRDVRQDRHYLCSLSEAVVLPIERYAGNTEAFCQNLYRQPNIFTPQDWREWGFRNWRLRTSLKHLRTEKTP